MIIIILVLCIDWPANNMCFVPGERAVNDIRMFARVPNSKYLSVTLQRYVKLNYGGVLYKALNLTPHKHLATSVCTLIFS